MLRAGVARSPMRLPRGTWLAGYPNPFRQHRSVRDPLRITALALEGAPLAHPAAHEAAARGRALLVSLDLLALHDDVATRWRHALAAALDLPVACIQLSCIHSHSAPLGSSLPASPPSQHAFLEALGQDILAASQDALAKLSPVRAFAARGQCCIGHNRRELRPDGTVVIGLNPDGGMDPDLALVQFQTERGEALATLVNHACHPTILSPLNRRASAEWPGEMRRRMEAEDAGVVMFLQGATGDVDPNHRWLRFGDRAVSRLGQQVAAAALDLLAGDLARLEGNGVGGAAETVSLPLEQRAEDHVEALSRMTGVPRRFVDPLLDRMYPWASTLAPNAEGLASVPVRVQSLRVGNMALASCGAEVFHSTGVSVKAASPTPWTLFAGYTNGMLGYVAPPEDHALGGYEVDLSPHLYRLPARFEAAAEPAIRAALGAQLEQLFEGG